MFLTLIARFSSGSTAESLRRAGCTSLMLLEARSRIGGRIYTDDLLGFPIDLGASWIRGVDGNPLADVPIRLEGLSNVMIFDQRNRPLAEDTSRDLIDCVWAARERLISAASSAGANSKAEPETLGDMPPSSLLSPTSTTSSNDSKAKRRRKLRRRQSWWERRRLSAMDEAGHTDGAPDAMEGVRRESSASSATAAAATTSSAEAIALGISTGALTREPDELDATSPTSPIGGLVGKDISVRDWILDEEEFCDDLNKSDVARKLLLDLVNVIEVGFTAFNNVIKVPNVYHPQNLEAVDLDSIGLLHFDRRGFGGPHLYVADGMAELVGATASGVLAEGNILRVNHIVSKIDYSADPAIDEYPVKLFTNRGLYQCKSVVLTIPLGVLKHHHTSFFNPPLANVSPKHKLAIERLGFGLIDKVILEFSSPCWPEQLDGFWAFMPPLKRGMDFDEGEDAPALVGFVNMERMHAAYEESGEDGMDVRLPGPPVLVAYVSQRSALRIEQMEDGEVGDLFTGILAKCFGAVSELVSVRVTRWDLDPFSRGACTYIPVGSSTPADIADLSSPLPFPCASQPIPNQAIYLAGEHCSRNHFATVHGALINGWSTGVKVARDLNIKPDNSETLVA
ncbi:Lysine-specific histone demethylase 1A [Phlyctochytrium planicorne]|nr:Lysine-specific histone demethylase 1A [Phlyctochytrium planicorne]